MPRLLETAPTLDDVERLARTYGVDDPFAAAIRGTRMAMVVADMQLHDHPIVFVNDAFLRLTGYERHEVLGRNCRFLQGPETDPESIDEMRRALQQGRETAVEVLNYRKDGSPFWNGVFISPVRSEQGDIVYYFGSQLDVTAKKEAEFALRDAKAALETVAQTRGEALADTLEQKTLLVHEVEHRVKNNLQLIHSLIQFQARRTENPEVRAALREVQERVGALSTVHRRLFQSADVARFDVDQFLGDLGEEALARIERADLRLELQVEPASAPAAMAAPLALLINELLTACVAVPPEDGGPRSLKLSSRADGGRLLIELSDDGPGSGPALARALAAPANIIDILRRQLGAEMRFEDNPDGLRAFITMPLERI